MPSDTLPDLWITRSAMLQLLDGGTVRHKRLHADGPERLLPCGLCDPLALMGDLV